VAGMSALFRRCEIGSYNKILSGLQVVTNVRGLEVALLMREAQLSATTGCR
jgi:hypothetical protein